MKRLTRYLAHGGLLLTLLSTSLINADDSAEEARLPLAELQLFAQVFEQIRAAYVEEVDDKTLIENAIVGLLGELDPHSAFLKEDSYKDLQEHTSGEFGGIGIEVGMEDGFIKVISPIDDTPASRAGIESGDLIIKLDNHAVQGMNLEEALNMMRGEKGSPLTLTIARENQSSPLIITVTRDIIKTASVRHKTLEDGFGYIRIAQFQANTGEEFRQSIQALKKDSSPLKGLILDLRNNPGGLLPASVEVVDAMLDGGLVVYTEGRAPSANTRFSAQAGELLQDSPLVILINAGSASASEIVAGAIQDHRRGVIMGTSSFGKGSVQNILPLSDGRAIKLTTARYFTPNGRSIQAEGIHPDIVVERAEIQRQDKQPSGIKEADLSGHLSQGTASPTASSPTKKRVKIKDYQLIEALNLLKGLAILSERPPVN